MIDPAPVSSATRAMRDGLVRSDDAPIAFDSVRARGPEGIKFDVWYCNAHVPSFAAAYQLSRLRRYTAPSSASYLAIGELDNVSDQKEIKRSTSAMPAMVEHHERFIGEPLGTQRRRDVSEDVIEAAVVYPAFLRAPHSRLPALSRWYDEEHLPMLLSCPQWVMARRFRITAAQGLDFTHVALHYLTNASALQSPQRDAARNTLWRDSLLAEGWFAPEYRVCYRVQDSA
jgi:hypothetical protein